MRQRTFAAAVLSLLAIAMGDVAAQTAPPTPSLQGLPPQSRPAPSTLVRVDPLRALQDQVAELKAQVATLKQANDALAAKIQALDGGMGQVVTQNVTQAKQISDLSSQVSGVSTKLANHQHAYTYKRPSYHTESFVKESGGVTSSDKMGNAAVMDGEYVVHEKTGPAE